MEPLCVFEIRRILRENLAADAFASEWRSRDRPKAQEQ
jgi:hypothetical protein